MNIQLIQVPYDSGHKDIRAGRGPSHFLQHGVDRMLRDSGHQVSSFRVESSASFTTEIGTAFELNRLLAEQVSSAVRSKMLPIVLAGNCNSCLGTIAGVGSDRLGVVWFDAHGDFNTPETTVSGFLDGMGLAMVTGLCWRSLLRTIPGFSPVSEANVLHIGSRDLDPEERRSLQQSEIEVVTPQLGEGRYRQAIGAALDKLQGNASRICLHVDMDVLDAGEAQANQLAVPGGLSVEVVEDVIGMVKERFEVCAGVVASFDPGCDKDDRVLNAGMRIIQAFVA
jgi:arginase